MGCSACRPPATTCERLATRPVPSGKRRGSPCASRAVGRQPRPREQALDVLGVEPADLVANEARPRTRSAAGPPGSRRCRAAPRAGRRGFAASRRRPGWTRRPDAARELLARVQDEDDGLRQALGEPHEAGKRLLERPLVELLPGPPKTSRASSACLTSSTNSSSAGPPARASRDGPRARRPTRPAAAQAAVHG